MPPRSSWRGVGCRLAAFQSHAGTSTPLRKWWTLETWSRRCVCSWRSWRILLTCSGPGASTLVLLPALSVSFSAEQICSQPTWLGWLQRGFHTLASLDHGLEPALVNQTADDLLFDLVCCGTAVLFLLILAWGMRWWLMSRPRLTERQCPRCGGRLRRVHRRRVDRLLSRYVPVSRYRCASGECQWEGLRVKGPRPD